MFTGINKKCIPVPLEMYLFSSIEMWFLPRNCKCTSNSLDLFVNIENKCGGAAEMDENSSMYKNNNNSIIFVGFSSEMSINTIVWMRIAHFCCSVIGRSRHAIVFFICLVQSLNHFSTLWVRARLCVLGKVGELW